MRSILFLLAMACAPVASAGVLVVGGAQQTHATIAGAVSAAVDGDVILVRVPWINFLSLDGKGVSVIADLPTPVLVDAIEVRNVPAGRSVVLAGFRIVTGGSTTVLLQSNAGHVRVQDFEILQGFASASAVLAFSCADVEICRSRIDGADGEFSSTSATPACLALRAVGSIVSVYDCQLTGGNGRNGGFFIGSTIPAAAGWGAPPVEGGSGSTLFLSGCTLTGGDGGVGWSPPGCGIPNNFPTDGGNAGDGLLVADAATTVRLRATTLTPGTPGAAGVDPCGNSAFPGFPGLAYRGPPASLVPIAGGARRMLAPSLAREATLVPLSFVGEPGDAVYLLTSLGAEQTWSPALGATQLVAAPFRRAFLGTLPPGGQLDVQVPISLLPPAEGEVQRHLQCVLVDALGASHGGTASVLTVLDQQY